MAWACRSWSLLSGGWQLGMVIWEGDSRCRDTGGEEMNPQNKSTRGRGTAEGRHTSPQDLAGKCDGAPSPQLAATAESVVLQLGTEGRPTVSS